jgi:uncharacterized protein
MVIAAGRRRWVQQANEAMREVVLSSAGRQLQARFFDPGGAPSPRPGLLFVHGLSSNQRGYQHRAEVASSALGAVCLTFDLSGHGRSTGNFDDLSPADHLVDVLAAYDALVSHEGIDAARVGVCGASYGAYLAGLLVSRRAVRRLLLRAPALYGDDEYTVPLRQRRVSRADSRAPMLFESLDQFAGEVLVLESGEDELIPHAVIETYLKVCPQARYEVIPDATHGLEKPEWNEAFVSILIDWFEEL